MIVKHLLERCSNINLCNYKEVCPLHFACQENRNNTVKLLLLKKAEVNSCSNDVINPMYIACQKGHADIVQHLLETE